MRQITKWQLISFVSRGLAMALGIIQSIFVARILSVSEYGVIGIVTAIGSVFGVHQNLGLASGSIRQISRTDDKTEIFKIFTTSVLIRYMINIPLSIGLFFGASYLAINKYHNVDLLLPLRLFSLILFIQAVQSIFNAVISGTQRFRLLFIYQIFIAFVSVFLYIPFVYFYKINGFFYAMLGFNIIGSLVLGYLALAPLRKHFSWPSLLDFKRLLKEILSISLVLYGVKILYTFWQKSGPLLLGLSLSLEQIGVFSFGLLYAGKIMAVSDAVTDVNLPLLSKKFIENLDEFKEVFGRNFDRVFAFIVFSASSAIYWSPELFDLALQSNKYNAALGFLLPMVFGFIFLSLLDIVKSSVLIPAKMTWQMMLSYISLILVTGIIYWSSKDNFGETLSMVYGLMVGAIFAFVITLFICKIKLDFVFFNFKHICVLILGLVFGLYNLYLNSGFESTLYGWDFLSKFAIYLVLVFVYIVLIIYIGFLSKNQIFKLLRLRL